MNEVNKIIEEKVKKIKDNLDNSKGKLTKSDYQEIKRTASRDKSQRRLGRAVFAFKEGNYVERGSLMQTYYGCNTCPFKSVCDKYPHTNGGCADRYRFIAVYLKRWQGDSLPLMQELAVVNELVATEQYEKDMKEFGYPSVAYIALRKLANDFHIHTQKQNLGSKFKIEKEITYSDINDKLFEYRKSQIKEAEIIKDG